MEVQPAVLKSLIIHNVGSKNNLDALVLSEKELEPDDETSQMLKDSFLSRFRDNAEYHAFTHTSSLHFNEMYAYCRQLFNAEKPFVEISTSMARHLYEQSTHPKVKGGELYICFFEGLPVDGRNHTAIGLFKTENKSMFLEATTKKRQVDMKMREGVELNKMDKGCLIINRKAEDGYDVLLFDNQNRGEEAQYWKEKFLGLTPQKNEFHHTTHLMALTKQFITGPLEAEENISRTEQVELLNRSLDYFKGNDSFDIENFQKEVFQDEERINAFRDFGSRYVEQNDYDIAASFDISAGAVKKQSRIFKSVLKLDKNFHIYIHGRTDLIEKGTDDNGRKFYKIYYQEEN